jgi:hypothetical protein
MNDGNPRYLEPRSKPRPAGGSRWFQFSLASVFVIVTAMALVLSTVFSVGRLVGMSNMEVLREGLKPFVYVLPTLMVWTVGLGMAIRRRKRNRAAAILTMIALGGLVLTVIVTYVFQMALWHLLTSGRTGNGPPDWAFTCLGAPRAVLYSTCWILILVAIFVKRPSDARQPERANPSGFAFSFESVFVIIAVTVVLATFFNVGGLLSRLAWGWQALLVWIVGLGIAIRRRKRNRAAAGLTIIALGGLVLTALASCFAQLTLIRLLTLGRITWGFRWGFRIIGVLYAVLEPIWWSLILLAIFAQRPPDDLDADRADPGGDADCVA